MKSWDPDWLSQWKEPDLAVVVSFGYFMPHRILNQFKLGAVNVHPSLLPRYRGAAPIHHSVLNGDSETGISIIELDRKRFDAGKILKQTVYEIPNHEHVLYQDLYTQLAERGGHELTDVILNFEEYQVGRIRN
jgi:methionyl-tRNA formyltransferase